MITAVCAVVVGVLLAGSDLADRWRGSRSERARIAEITATLDRFQWLVLEDLAEARHNVLHRDRTSGNDEIRAFIAARERHPGRDPGRGGGVPPGLTGSSGNGRSNR
ncbi:hypothetical protein O4328_42090 [Rhodococcus opacus]|uniref:Uncharacterized protein n=1 Tax=Rhodococcus opacus TaxID=37919 RepID=A0AAX3YV85_RHOOP|nr:hypothetical protein [Rhodococcus opacus]MCZ4590141.1 hypothetical protein [Rhodococcus opacus]WLF52177.1 hypothetical protein Q5707_42955 [Rhodococcus opacus]